MYTKIHTLHSHMNSVLSCSEKLPLLPEKHNKSFTLCMVTNKASHANHTDTILWVQMHRPRSQNHSYIHAYTVAHSHINMSHVYAHTLQSHISTNLNSYILIYFLRHLVIESQLCSDIVTHSHPQTPCHRGVSPPHQDLLTLWHQPRHQLVLF